MLFAGSRQPKLQKCVEPADAAPAQQQRRVRETHDCPGLLKGGEGNEREDGGRGR